MQLRTPSSAYSRALLTLAAVGALGACKTDDTPPETVEVTGVVTVGEPIVNATVNARCDQNVTASTTTDNRGIYTLEISEDVLPCVVQVSGGSIGVGGAANLVKYHSVTTYYAGIIRTNVTPLTDLVLARAVSVAGLNYATWFSDPASIHTFENVEAEFADATADVALALVSAGYPASLMGFNPFSVVFSIDDASLDHALVRYFVMNASFTGHTHADFVALADAGGELPFWVGPAEPATIHSGLQQSSTLEFRVHEGVGSTLFTDGELIPVSISGNSLTIKGKTYTHPYHGLIGGTPYVTTASWYDPETDLIFTVENNENGNFEELRVGNIRDAVPGSGQPVFVGRLFVPTA